MPSYCNINPLTRSLFLEKGVKTGRKVTDSQLSFSRENINRLRGMPFLKILFFYCSRLTWRFAVKTKGGKQGIQLLAAVSKLNGNSFSQRTLTTTLQ